MIKPVLYTAKPTYDVNDGVLYRTLDSTKNQLKEYMRGSGSVNINSTNAWKVPIEVNHNLGYQPFFLGWWKWNDDTKVKKIPSPFIGADATFFSGMDRIDTNLIVIWFYAVAQVFPPVTYNEDFTYEYIIYIDPNKDAWS